MKVAVFSDVHGNLPALELMIRDAGPVDGYVCLGDVVNYGPWSNECVDLVASLPSIVFIEGNHERYFAAGRYGGANDLAQRFFDVCFPDFTRFSAISNLKDDLNLANFRMSHTLDDIYIYPDTPIQLKASHMIGHTHRQFIISQPPHVLYNVGSVGQNRQHIGTVNYLTVDLHSMKVQLRAVEYDENLILDEMKLRGYPNACIEYYAGKRARGPRA